MTNEERLALLETVSRRLHDHADEGGELLAAICLGGIMRFEPDDPLSLQCDRLFVSGRYRAACESLPALAGDAFPSAIRVVYPPAGAVLSQAVGVAIALKGRSESTVWALLDGEYEPFGNVAEAARHAGELRLANVACVVHLAQARSCRPAHEPDQTRRLTALWEAYGWDVRHITDAHAMPAVLHALRQERSITRPTVIFAHDTERSNTPAARSNGTRPALASVSDSTPDGDALLRYLRQAVIRTRDTSGSQLFVLTTGAFSAARAGHYGLGEPHVRFLDFCMRERHLLTAAQGIAACEPSAHIIVVAQEAALTRSVEELAALARARAHVVVIGTDPGVCVTRRGASTGSISEPAALAAIPGLDFIEPADAAEFERSALQALLDEKGPVYLRIHPLKAPPLPPARTSLGAYVAWEPVAPPEVVFIGSGLTVGGLITAARELDLRDIGARVVNVVAPTRLTRRFSELLVHGAPVFVAYNGDPNALAASVSRAIMSAVSVRPSQIVAHGVTHAVPGSYENLEAYFELDAPGLVRAVNRAFPELFVEKIFANTAARRS